MSRDQSSEACQKWITDQQNLLETADYGRNKKAIDQAVQNQRTKSDLITSYQQEIDRSSFSDDNQKSNVLRAYNNLNVIASKRLGCLESMADIVKLEELFGTLSNEFTEKATHVTQGDALRKEPSTDQYDGSIANSSQSAILAVRDTWAWIGKLLKCSEVHLDQAAEYQQFFHELRQYQQWMPVELTRAEQLLNSHSLKRNAQGEDAGRLLMEMKTALTMFLHWRGKVDTVFEKSRKIIPVYLRNRKLEHSRPVVALASYKTNEVNIQEGEEVTLINNSKTQTWQIRNLRSQETEVPSTILVIPGPDPNAVEGALKLCLQFLSTWTNMVKRIGSTIIRFLLEVIRDWTPDEERMLRALSPTDKQEMLNLFKSIEQTFSPYWDEYGPFKQLKQRMVKTRDILSQSSNGDSKDTSNGQLLVIQTSLLEELLGRFRDFWSFWEKYKVLTETCRHPEYLLVTKNWEDYKFINTADWLKKFGTSLDMNEEDWDELDGGLNGYGSSSVDGTLTMERSKETAETSHITTSEQEEKQTFVITSVIDPRTGEEISLDHAISQRVINQTEGKYVNPTTGETMPIPMAMNAGKIKVEFTTVKKSVEKKRDIGLITIKTYKESRPYQIKEVIDSITDRHMSVDEAVHVGILDQKKGVYRNKNTKEELSLADALDSGLLVVEFEPDSALNSHEPEVQTKTYAVHGVVDMKSRKRLAYREAILAGIINPDTGAYYNNETGESVYVGDAIKKGHIKATVVLDPKQLDIAPGNVVTLDDSAINRFKQMSQPLHAINALKRAGANAVVNGNGYANGNGTTTNGK